MSEVKPRLCEPGVKYFLSNTLKECRNFKDKNISFFFTIIDSGSSNSDLNKIESKMKNSMIDFNIESLNLDDYDMKSILLFFQINYILYKRILSLLNHKILLMSFFSF